MSIYKEYKMGMVSESEFREYGRLEAAKEKDWWERKCCGNCAFECDSDDDDVCHDWEG